MTIKSHLEKNKQTGSGQPSSSQRLHEYLKITKPTGSGWKRVKAPHILDRIPFKSEDIGRGNNL